MKEDMKNLLTEERARDLLDFAFPALSYKLVNEAISNLKQAGIIQKSALEEYREKKEDAIKKDLLGSTTLGLLDLAEQIFSELQSKIKELEERE